MRSRGAAAGRSGSGARVGAASPSGAPHPPQKRLLAGLARPQAAHGAGRAEPHCPQNLSPVGLSAPHDGHAMPRLPGRSAWALSGSSIGAAGRPFNATDSPASHVAVTARTARRATGG